MNVGANLGTFFRPASQSPCFIGAPDRIRTCGLCLRRAAPIALFALCARFVADSGASRGMSARVSLGYAKKPRLIGGAYHG